MYINFLSVLFSLPIEKVQRWDNETRHDRYKTIAQCEAYTGKEYRKLSNIHKLRSL